MSLRLACVNAMTQTFERPVCTGQADCRECVVRDVVLFADLEDGDLRHLYQPIEQFSYKRGSPIFHIGDSGGAIYTIREGVVKLVQYLPDGTQRIVGLLRQGSVAGLEALLGKPYEHTTICLEKTLVCRIVTEDVQRLMLESKHLHRQLLERWYQAVRDADQWITSLSTGDARARMARLFLYLATGPDEDECRLFSREDVGAVLGLTPETASHIIAGFKRDGVIEQQARNLYRCDRRALSAIAGY